MQSDIEIAQKTKPKPILKISKKAGLKNAEIELHGQDKGKINFSAFRRLKNKKDGKLILVTTITPTAQGEGKTTVTIGLSQALRRLGKKAIACIREPSLGPVMGLKGGAAGGGFSQVVPMDDINLHLTGDMHMITSAHNLLAAMLYNHIYQGNELKLNEKRIFWKRVMDMNDRSLRGMFDITASSEVMAILCLSKNIEDMKKRLGKIFIGINSENQVIQAKDIKAEGAMALLMWHALKPNLVQTIEGDPVFIHGGPFANIAHGCSSLMATNLALKLSDYVVTEAGFGTDLGAEKFFNIKCRVGDLNPSAVVLVVTKQAIDVHGYENVAKHIENIKYFGIPLVIAINKKSNDTENELMQIITNCNKLGVETIICDVWANGGKGGKELAQSIVKTCRKKTKLRLLYDLKDSVEDKIETITKCIYGADGATFTDEALKDLDFLKAVKLDQLPICIAKTQYSLSDNAKLQGRPTGFKITVNGVKASAGAGFIVAYTGAILTMPGLPKHPAAENMDINEAGIIKGLF